jgi:hypothetical protein
MDDAVGFPRLCCSRTGGHGTPENDSVRFLYQSVSIHFMKVWSSRRDTAPNRSIALIKFRKVESALEFAEAYNGKAFNSMNVSPSLPANFVDITAASCRVASQLLVTSFISRL